MAKVDNSLVLRWFRGFSLVGLFLALPLLSLAQHDISKIDLNIPYPSTPESTTFTEPPKPVKLESVLPFEDSLARIHIGSPESRQQAAQLMLKIGLEFSSSAALSMTISQPRFGVRYDYADSALRWIRRSKTTDATVTSEKVSFADALRHAYLEKIIEAITSNRSSAVTSLLNSAERDDAFDTVGLLYSKQVLSACPKDAILFVQSESSNGYSLDFGLELLFTQSQLQYRTDVSVVLDVYLQTPGYLKAVLDGLPGIMRGVEVFHYNPTQAQADKKLRNKLPSGYDTVFLSEQTRKRLTRQMGTEPPRMIYEPVASHFGGNAIELMIHGNAWYRPVVTYGGFIWMDHKIGIQIQRGLVSELLPYPMPKGGPTPYERWQQLSEFDSTIFADDSLLTALHDHPGSALLGLPWSSLFKGYDMLKKRKVEEQTSQLLRSGLQHIWKAALPVGSRDTERVTQLLLDVLPDSGRALAANFYAKVYHNKLVRGYWTLADRGRMYLLAELAALQGKCAELDSFVHFWSVAADTMQNPRYFRVIADTATNISASFGCSKRAVAVWLDKTYDVVTPIDSLAIVQYHPKVTTHDSSRVRILAFLGGMPSPPTVVFRIYDQKTNQLVLQDSSQVEVLSARRDLLPYLAEYIFGGKDLQQRTGYRADAVVNGLVRSDINFYLGKKH